MNNSYEIPPDKTSCCYNSKTETLETPSSLPEELRIWTSLNLEDYSNIVKKCNSHFARKQKTSYLLFLIFIPIAVAVILFVKKPFSQSYIAIILASSLLIIIAIHFYVFVKVNKKFEKTIVKLNEKYSDKGIKVDTAGLVVGSGKNRKTITKIHIMYTQDWNKQPKSQFLEPHQTPQHLEIELSSIQPSIQAPSYYVSPIPPPSAPYSNDTVSLDKDVNDSI